MVSYPFKPHNAMKTFALILVVLSLAVASQAQPQPPRSGMGVPVPASPPPAAPTVAAKDLANYLIRVEWKEPKGEAKTLEVLTAEGNFSLDGLQKNSVKINNNDVPVTFRCNGGITAFNDEKGRLQLFLGRTVPYVTGTMGNGSSSYSQMSVGLSSTFNVTFGKPTTIQSDENGQIVVLVKRLTD